MPSSTNYGLFGAPSTVDDLRTTATHHRGSPFTFTSASSICLLRRILAVLQAGFEPAAYRSSDTGYGLRRLAVVSVSLARSSCPVLFGLPIFKRNPSFSPKFFLFPVQEFFAF